MNVVVVQVSGFAFLLLSWAMFYSSGYDMVRHGSIAETGQTVWVCSLSVQYVPLDLHEREKGWNVAIIVGVYIVSRTRANLIFYCLKYLFWEKKVKINDDVRWARRAVASQLNDSPRGLPNYIVLTSFLIFISYKKRHL